MALLFLVFPCGLIRGALANLGITAIVNADVTTLPGCTSHSVYRQLSPSTHRSNDCVCPLGLFNIKIKGM
jgi:hypothetical protein